MILGYLLGEQSSLKPVDRILLGAICGFIGGLITNLVLEPILQPSESVMLISVISCLAGALFGETLNWAPAPQKAPKRYVYFDPEDDDEFDREIEGALRGSSD